MDNDELEVMKAGAEGAAAGALKSFHELLSKLAGPAAEEAGLAWRDNVRVWRLSRALRLAKRVNEMLEAHGGTVKPVNLKVLLPSLEHASLEDDDYLQDRWAALLANAASEGNQKRMISVFVEILKQLSAPDVRLLEKCHKEMKDITPPYLIGDFHALWDYHEEPSEYQDEEQFRIVLENLFRLGLLMRRENRRKSERFFSGEDDETTIIENQYLFTRLGFEFVTTCRPKDANKNISENT